MLGVLQAIDALPLGDLRLPILERGCIELQRTRLPQADHVFQRMGHVAHHRNVDLHCLVDGGWVDVDVDFLGEGREGIEAAGDAVVEARTHAHHHVAIMHGHVGLVSAVHAQHAQPFLAARRIGTEAHERGGDGNARHRHELAQQLEAVGPELMTPPPV